MPRKKSQHYVNNKEFLAAMTDYKNAVKKANSKIEASTIVGHAIGEKIKQDKIDRIVFDRNGYKYHGRVKALAEAIRSTGIKF